MSNAIQSGQFDLLKHTQIIPFSMGNSRKKNNASKRQELKESIKASGGVNQPVLVRPSSQEGVYELIAGYGRYESCVDLDFDVPAYIKDLSDREAFEAQLAENLIRDDLSLVDEAKAAQTYLALSEGDYATASSKLGWSKKKLEDRINLNRCSERVLEALSDDKIQLGHAVILSSFTENLQNGTLDKILSENWSVKYLKERAGKAKKFLHTAKFDTTSCNTCPNNTSHQIGMFDMGADEKAQCAKLTCWKEKTNEWLNSQKLIAEEKYGKVLLYVECGEKDRNTVSETAVGKEQFNTGCIGCESNVVLLDDRDGRQGQLIESQCIDQVCFKKCQKKLVDTAKQDLNNDSANAKKSNKNPSTKTPEKSISQKTPSAVIDNEKALLHGLGEKHASTQEWFIHGFMIASISTTTGYTPSYCDKKDTFEQRVLKAKEQPFESIQLEIDKAIKNCVKVNAKAVDERFVMNSKSLMINALALLANANELAIAAWQPTEEILKAYTSEGIKSLCKEANFDKAFDSAPINIDKKTTFSKLSNKSKGDFIKGILAFEFDWSSFAPSTLLKHLNK
ncbi:PRTRC system ParB family protein [Pseudoalteromonas spongiae]|uniref:PRTRC system ParB family protein n=1 Tax=Pseudoalteromonas spongiae TaxID=298657 RepID=UPI0012FE74D0|nr:PRTRC system ParB family protein [Pseudoalteromonas spongiae]